MMEITKLKKLLKHKLAELREAETTSLPAKRKAIKIMDKEYFHKLKQ